jgi:hypothetical protein
MKLLREAKELAAALGATGLVEALHQARIGAGSLRSQYTKPDAGAVERLEPEQD